MIPPLTLVLLALACANEATTAPTAATADSRVVAFTYAVTVPATSGDSPVELFLPIPISDRQQDIENLSVDAPASGTMETEATFSNRFWHGTLGVDQLPATVTLSFLARRRSTRVDPASAALRVLTEAERAEFARALAPSARVPVGEQDEVLAPLLADVRRVRADESPASTARAIYDWVRTHMEYKKTGTGWGNGDTYWACSERYGNCTDFHSVFLSLARTEGIPATFEMGFPIPPERSEGLIDGYHCWVQFWLPDVGWIPIDASEAARHPERAEQFYGGQPADRIRFTTGRDLRLGSAHKGPSLNYFIYPYAERDGMPWDAEIARTISYREVAP